MGWASLRHFCFICSLSNGCKFISGFTCGNAAGSIGKLSMINLLAQYTPGINIKPILLVCVIIDVVIVKSSLLLFLGIIKSNKCLLWQWILVIIIGKTLIDAVGLYLGFNKLTHGYNMEGFSDIAISVFDALLYAYFALAVYGLALEIATDEAVKLLADQGR